VEKTGIIPFSPALVDYSISWGTIEEIEEETGVAFSRENFSNVEKPRPEAHKYIIPLNTNGSRWT